MEASCQCRPSPFHPRGRAACKRPELLPPQSWLRRNTPWRWPNSLEPCRDPPGLIPDSPHSCRNLTLTRPLRRETGTTSFLADRALVVPPVTWAHRFCFLTSILGVGGVSFVELCILYELWRGLFLRKVFQSTCEVPLGPGTDILRSASLCVVAAFPLPAWWGGSLPSPPSGRRLVLSLLGGGFDVEVVHSFLGFALRHVCSFWASAGMIRRNPGGFHRDV